MEPPVAESAAESAPLPLSLPPARDLYERERIGEYARWFIRMRWIAVLVAAVLVCITTDITHLLPPELRWPLYLLVAAMAGFNALFLALRRQRRWAAPLLLFQVYTDLGLLTLLLHFSGGVENPLYLLALFHVIISGILLSRRQCYGVAAAAGGLFSLLVWLEWSGVVQHYPLLVFPHYPLPGLHHEGGALLHAAHQVLYVASITGMQFLLLFLTAYFATTLAEQVRSKERQLEAMTDYALAERQLLEQALETTGTGLCVLDRELRPHWINNRWKQWFAPGAPADLRPGPADEERSRARQTLADGAVRFTELALPRADDRPSDSPPQGPRILQVVTAPLLDKGEHIAQVVELAQDITEQKQAQARLVQAGKLAAIGELAGNIAHEINNPIAIISAKARLLLADHPGGMSQKVGEELKKIVDLADRIAGIAQGLLSYYRPAARTRMPIDIRVPLRRSLAMVEQRARASGVEIEERFAVPVPLVQANANELEQVFLNLFLNALDAMPEGGRLIVSILAGGVQLADGKFCIAVTVEDTGNGIPPEIRERIFEPFFTTKEEGRGTGLGLSICLGLARNHGGEIEVDSTPGKGARFAVKLPLATGEEASDG